NVAFLSKFAAFLTITRATCSADFAIIHLWALESTGEQISVAILAVPEATSSLLFALAAAAFLVRGRKF
ncbi:MAG TPA: hypothetical protein DDW21_07945, partial [Verrucomicrobiales bacterium]|nr:hypothetical protein [Verrucomicrobiales bacterium]